MAQQVSMQEYENSDYTKKALQELNEQLKEFKFKKSREDTEDIESENSDEDLPILIVNSPKKRKAGAGDKPGHAELLQNRVDKLQKALRKQGDELDTAEIRLYQTRLELSNSNVALENQKQQTNTGRIENSELKKRLFTTKAKYYCSMVINAALAYYILAY